MKKEMITKKFAVAALIAAVTINTSCQKHENEPVIPQEAEFASFSASIEETPDADSKAAGETKTYLNTDTFRAHWKTGDRVGLTFVSSSSGTNAYLNRPLY